MNSEMPSPDDLLTMGHFWDGERANAVNGSSYWRFMIFKYKDKKTYVLENHWEKEIYDNDGQERCCGGELHWYLRQEVKRIY